MMPSRSDTVAAVNRLKQEIEQLTQEQDESLQSATYLGMTAEQAKQHDSRRENIRRLLQQLALLEKDNDDTVQEENEPSPTPTRPMPDRSPTTTSATD